MAHMILTYIFCHDYPWGGGHKVYSCPVPLLTITRIPQKVHILKFCVIPSSAWVVEKSKRLSKEQSGLNIRSDVAAIKSAVEFTLKMEIAN